MELNFADILTDEMKSAMITLKAETKEMFRNTRPFRQVRVTNTERIANYLNTPPEVHQNWQSTNPIEYDNYVNSMEQLISKFKGVE